MNKPMRGNKHDSKHQPKANAKTFTARDTKLSARNLPDQVGGVSPDFFLNHELRCIISGTKQLVWYACKISDVPGNAGKRILLEDLQRYARSVGFVAQSKKETAKDELTQDARSMFYLLGGNANIDLVSEPRLKAKELKTMATNYEENCKMLKQYKPVDETDLGFVRFYIEMANRGAEAMEEIFEAKLAGREVDSDQEMIDAGFPQSMKGKIFGNQIKLTGHAKFWTTLVGKSLANFSALTVREVREMEADKLRVFNLDKDLVAFLKNDAEIAKMLNQNELKDVSEKLKNEFFGKSVPHCTPLNKIETLKRMGQTKEITHLANLEQSRFKTFDQKVNTLLKSILYLPPKNLKEVRAYWEKLAGGALVDIVNASKDYRQQAIEKLEEQPEFQGFQLDPRMIGMVRGGIRHFQVFEHTAANLFSVTIESTDAEGNLIIENQSYRDYHPRQLEMKESAGQSKKRERSKMNIASALTKESRHYVEELGKYQHVTKSLLKDVKTFLEEFTDLELQGMAAKKILLTCLLNKKDAQSRYLEEYSENEEGSSEDEADGAEEEKDETFETIVPATPSAKAKKEETKEPKQGTEADGTGQEQKEDQN